MGQLFNVKLTAFGLGLSLIYRYSFQNNMSQFLELRDFYKYNFGIIGHLQP